MNLEYPLKIPAIRVTQPFRDYFIVSLKATYLTEVSFSDPLKYEEGGSLSGSQRDLRRKRIDEISEYIKRYDAAFPNSIILSANYDQDGNLCEDTAKRWTVEYDQNCNIYYLVIPTSEKLASIIDGQHRVNGFMNVDKSVINEIDLLVSIYLDLPNPFQAYIFATINYHQKSVDRSLAMEQWGYSLETSDPDVWSPEMLAVFLTRKLNSDEDSPFHQHIKVAPQNEHFLFPEGGDVDWKVSTATIVDGIVRLITKNPQKDLNALRQTAKSKRTREILKEIKYEDCSLRDFYLEKNDLLIYKIVFNYFTACKNLFFDTSPPNSYIKKTVGIQALFDVLSSILKDELHLKKISVEYYTNKLDPFKEINFADNYFQASGAGKNRIKNLFLYGLGLKSEFTENKRGDKKTLISEEDMAEIHRLLET